MTLLIFFKKKPNRSNKIVSSNIHRMGEEGKKSESAESDLLQGLSKISGGDSQNKRLETLSIKLKFHVIIPFKKGRKWRSFLIKESIRDRDGLPPPSPCPHGNHHHLLPPSPTPDPLCMAASPPASQQPPSS
jgi:hypothetical protein